MHAHNRTLIAKLGFADPDRNEPLHDKACRYVGRPEVAKKLIEGLLEPHFQIAKQDGESWYVYSDGVGYRMTTAPPTASFEIAISKGSGQDKTTVGFMDVLLKERMRRLYAPRLQGDESPAQADDRMRKDWARDHNFDGKYWFADESHRQIAVEVKIAPTSYSEVLRQINLYREFYEDASAWLLAVAFDVNESYVETLAKERVHVVRLGQAFRDWAAAEQANAVTAKLDEI